VVKVLLTEVVGAWVSLSKGLTASTRGRPPGQVTIRDALGYPTSAVATRGHRHPQGWREGRRLSSWARNALPVAIDPG